MNWYVTQYEGVPLDIWDDTVLVARLALQLSEHPPDEFHSIYDYVTGILQIYICMYSSELPDSSTANLTVSGRKIRPSACLLHSINPWMMTDNTEYVPRQQRYEAWD